VAVSKLVVVPGKDSTGHGENAVAIAPKFFAIVRDHGEDVLIVLTGQDCVTGDNDGLAAVMNNDGYVTGHVPMGYQELKVIWQRVSFDPAKT